MPAGKVFLNYRHDDSEGYAGRIYDRLNARLPGRVFRDVSGLQPGEDFVEVLEREGGSCQVLVAVIGRRWLTITDAQGRRRLDLPDDFVRSEIVSALKRKIPIIPVLVGNAAMPQAEELPSELAFFARRQAVPITEIDFDTDIDRLIRALERCVGDVPSGAPPPAKPSPEEFARGQQGIRVPLIEQARPRKPKRLVWLLGGTALALIVLLVMLFAIAASLSQTQQPNSAVNVAPASTPLEFNPVGRWSVSHPTAGLVAVLQLSDDRRFIMSNQSSILSAGTWEYAPLQQMITLTGVNNTGARFRGTITIERGSGNTFVAADSQLGQVVITRQ